MITCSQARRPTGALVGPVDRAERRHVPRVPRLRLRDEQSRVAWKGALGDLQSRPEVQANLLGV